MCKYYISLLRLTITTTEIDLSEPEYEEYDTETKAPTTTVVYDLFENFTQYTTTTDRISSDTWTPTETTTQRPRTTSKPRQRFRQRTTTTTQPWNGSWISTTTEWSTAKTINVRPTRGSCENITEYKITDKDLQRLNDTDKDRLRKLCWETMFGQELVKLTIMDFVLTVISTLISDFIRALIVRYSKNSKFNKFGNTIRNVQTIICSIDIVMIARVFVGTSKRSFPDMETLRSLKIFYI